MPSWGASVLWSATAVALFANAPAMAGSALRLPYPVESGRIPASTYDENGERVGGAHLLIEWLDSGNLRMLAQSGFEHGARTVASAELAPAGDGAHLQLLSQESRSFDGDGQPRGVLFIDHREGVASCRSPEARGGEVKTLALPAEDRVANVPMTLDTNRSRTQRSCGAPRTYPDNPSGRRSAEGPLRGNGAESACETLHGNRPGARRPMFARKPRFHTILSQGLYSS